MRLYFERIDPEEDKFTATIKGDSKVLLDLLDWYLNYLVFFPLYINELVHAD